MMVAVAEEEVMGVVEVAFEMTVPLKRTPSVMGVTQPDVKSSVVPLSFLVNHEEETVESTSSGM